MKDRKIKFRTAIIGGFDRRDVMRYIKRLSEERNELRLRLAERGMIDEESELSEGRKTFKTFAEERSRAEDVLHALEARHEELGEQIRDLRRTLG